MGKPEHSKLGRLEAVKRHADEWGVLPQELKPCVAAMIDEGVPRGSHPVNPNAACHIIACELRRLDHDEPTALACCREWQAGTASVSSRLGDGEIRKTVRSAFRSDYTYGCGLGGPLYNSGYCLGHQECPYYQQLGGSRKPRDMDFFEFGWPARLMGSAACRVYTAIIAIEQKRGCPGGTTFADYRLLQKYSGVTIGHMRETLEYLQEVGLITFTAGQPGRSRHAATEIQRVVPIPEPPKPAA